jgi:hypothetical protein
VKATLEISPEELRRVRPDLKAPVPERTRTLSELQRAFEKLEEQQFLEAVSAYSEGR